MSIRMLNSLLRKMLARIFPSAVPQESTQNDRDSLEELAVHPSGYKRELAVRSLSEQGSPTALPVLLKRVNDWVPQVRDAAVLAVRKLMVPENAQYFVFCISDVLQLRRCGRVNHKLLEDEITRFLLDPCNSRAMLGGLESREARTRRACFALILGSTASVEEKIVLRAIHDPDSLVQRMGVDRLRFIRTSEIDSALNVCLSSRDPRVRRDSLFFWLAQDGAQLSASSVGKYIFDRSVSVRTQAIRWLQDRGVDVLELVLKRFRDPTEVPKNVRLAILTIVQLEGKRLLPEILEKLESEYPAVRFAVLFAMAKFDSELFRARFVDLLRDPSPAVVKLLVRLRILMGVQFDASQLQRIVECDSRDIVVRSVLLLAKYVNKWERLALILGLPTSAPSLVSTHESLLRQEIADWQSRFNRSATVPTREQGERVRAAVGQCESFLSVRQKQEILFALKSF